MKRLLMATLTGCLDYERMHLRFDVKKLHGEVVYKNLVSDDPSSVDADYAELVRFRDTPQLEADNPGWHNVTKALYEEDGQLHGRVSFEVGTLADGPVQARPPLGDHLLRGRGGALDQRPRHQRRPAGLRGLGPAHQGARGRARRRGRRRIQEPAGAMAGGDRLTQLALRTGAQPPLLPVQSSSSRSESTTSE